MSGQFVGGAKDDTHHDVGLLHGVVVEQPSENVFQTDGGGNVQIGSAGSLGELRQYCGRRVIEPALQFAEDGRVRAERRQLSAPP